MLELEMILHVSDSNPYALAGWGPIYLKIYAPELGLGQKKNYLFKNREFIHLTVRNYNLIK